jgi:hypothetical protein
MRQMTELENNVPNSLGSPATFSGAILDAWVPAITQSQSNLETFTASVEQSAQMFEAQVTASEALLAAAESSMTAMKDLADAQFALLSSVFASESEAQEVLDAAAAAAIPPPPAAPQLRSCVSLPSSGVRKFGFDPYEVSERVSESASAVQCRRFDPG